MSTEEPDSAYIYLKKQFGKTDPKSNCYVKFWQYNRFNKVLNDSLQNATFISGAINHGLWMSKNTPTFTAIHHATKTEAQLPAPAPSGSNVEHMITKSEIRIQIHGAFNNRYDNLETTNRFGTWKNVIIDQHKRSRYNRLPLL
jgi:cyanophycinase